MTHGKHTPGAWFVNKESSDVGDGKLSIEVAGDYFIAQVDENFCQEANARLIASAPDMLEALIDVRRALETANFTGELAVVDAAIKKATE